MEENKSTEADEKKSSFGRSKKDKHTEEQQAKSWAREWLDALVFAFIVAAILRQFLFGSYRIPTGSMEQDLLIGDMLIVSNVTYGPRTPMSVCVPFTSWCLPGIKLPWTRIPGYGDVERNDVIVFNVPWEVKPISQKTNYIKRAVGIPGDTLELRDKVLYVNGEEEAYHEGVQKFYDVIVRDNVRLSDKKMESVGAGTIGGNERYVQQVAQNVYRVNLTKEVADVVASWPEVDSMALFIIPEDQQLSVYTMSKGSFSQAFNNPDHFSAFVVPYEGQEITLTKDNWYIYKDLIERYEHNDVKVENNAFVINGESTNKYVVKQDYYFGMGDNRDSSEDSRFWGFIPRDHMIGKAVLVWFSLDGAVPRFSRIFHLID